MLECVDSCDVIGRNSVVMVGPRMKVDSVLATV